MTVATTAVGTEVGVLTVFTGHGPTLPIRGTSRHRSGGNLTPLMHNGVDKKVDVRCPHAHLFYSFWLWIGAFPCLRLVHHTHYCRKKPILILSMFSLLTFVVLCLASRETRAIDEELETDQFIDALCVPETRKAIAQCADLLPQTGKETVYSCGRNVSQTFQDKMILAAETFCDREDIRDLLFLCWEKGLSELYETSREEEVDEDISKGMNDFQACLQEVLDGLFEE